MTLVVCGIAWHLKLAGRLEIAIGWFKCIVRASFDIGNLTERQRESGQAHIECRVCSWRVSLRLGLGGEAELPPCRSWVGRALSCEFVCIYSG